MRQPRRRPGPPVVSADLDACDLPEARPGKTEDGVRAQPEALAVGWPGHHGLDWHLADGTEVSPLGVHENVPLSVVVAAERCIDQFNPHWPLHAGDAWPAWHQESDGAAIRRGNRIAVHGVRQQYARISGHRERQPTLTIRPLRV